MSSVLDLCLGLDYTDEAMENKTKEKLLKALARITRRFHPKGTEKVLKLFYPKNPKEEISAVVPYDEDLHIHVNTGSLVEWEIFFKEYSEPEITYLIKRLLPKRGTFVDVGANIGEHTLVAAKIAKEVIAIEPDGYLADRLEANVRLNALQNVRIWRSATDVLDGLIDFKVDMININTEGQRVIRGARETISKFNPVIIFKSGHDESNESAVSFLKHEGYSLYLIGQNKITPIEGRCEGDILCIPLNL